MGYWEEKARYNEENYDKNFCSSCGIILENKNTFGKCVECGNLVCKSCGSIEDKKVVCLNCKEEKDTYECDKCNEEFIINKQEAKKLEKNGSLKIKCPHCNLLVTLEGENIIEQDYCKKIEKGVYECNECGEEFELEDKDFKRLEKERTLSLKCPSCKEEVFCELKKGIIGWFSE